MKKLLFATLLPLLSLSAACDEGALPDPGSSLRANKVYYATSKSMDFSSNGTDNPDGPSGTCPGGNLHEIELAAVLRNADSIYASAFAQSLDGKVCNEVCAEQGGEWGGEAVAHGEYDVGETEWLDTEEGVSWSNRVHGEVELGCVCEGIE